MISIIVTSYKEEKTIYKTIINLVNPKLSGFNEKLELITVIPDLPTIKEAKRAISNFPTVIHTHITDPLKGKPFALNLALKIAKGDILVLTDGDVYFKENALDLLIKKLKSDENIGGVTGRSVSNDSKNDFMGYIGHLLADAAHHKRMVTMSEKPTGKSLKIVSNTPNFFVLSGYILAMKNYKISLPDDALSEDAYISYILHNKNFKLAYEPDAVVYVKYAKTLKDWYKQKLRSVGGYIQLWKYNIVRNDTKVRNFWKELEYFWFPIKYAKTLKEYIWSTTLYPIRLILWIKIFWEQRILKRDLIGDNGWERIESTK